jgi:hypothetical protein
MHMRIEGARTHLCDLRIGELDVEGDLELPLEHLGRHGASAKALQTRSVRVRIGYESGVDIKNILRQHHKFTT